MKILSGTSNLKLSKDISKNLKLKLINTNIRRFADGEIYIEINENIRGNSVFVIQSTSNPANDNIMELLLVIYALKMSSAKKITAENQFKSNLNSTFKNNLKETYSIYISPFGKPINRAPDQSLVSCKSKECFE